MQISIKEFTETRIYKMSQNGSPRTVIIIAQNSISVMNNFKEIPHLTSYQINFISNLKTKDFFVAQRKIVHISLFVSNLSFFLLNESYRIEL